MSSVASVIWSPGPTTASSRSRSKLHYHLGLEKTGGRQYDFVVPNYFNSQASGQDAGEPSEAAPLVYMGRITAEKGMQIIVDLAAALPGRRFYIAGQGNFSEFFGKLPNVHYFGVLAGAERANFLKGALVALMPTLYVEPFGGAGVEVQLSGVPLLASHFGAFSEILEHGHTGYLCRTLGDWASAIEEGPFAESHSASERRAQNLYGMERVGRMYDVAFKTIHQL